MKDLDKVIEHFSFKMENTATIIVGGKDFNKGVRDLLIELKQLRRSQMQPAVKFLGNSIQDQFNHVISEINEIENEIYPPFANKIDKEKALDECNDGQISLESLKAIIEPDENKRRESMIKTIAKNDARGYYKAE